MTATEAETGTTLIPAGVDPIVAVQSGAITAEIAFKAGNAARLIDVIKARARAAAAKEDPLTPKGREALMSIAHTVARTKTGLDGMGKDLVESEKKRLALIDRDRKTFRDELDALRDEIKQPALDWKARDDARIQGHLDAIAAIPEPPGYGQVETAEEIRVRLDWLTGTMPARDWQEFWQRAADVIAAEVDRTRLLLAAAVKREEEAAELARLRAAEAERQRIDGHQLKLGEFSEMAQVPDKASSAAIEARIAAARAIGRSHDWQEFADLAERAREDALVALNTALAAALEREAAAQAERERLIAARAAEEARQKAEAAALRQLQEADRVAAEALAEQAKAAREAEEAAKRAKTDAARAEAARVMAEARAAQEAKAAAEAAERATQQALETERQTVAAAAAREAKAAADREANVAHRKAVNSAALADLVLHAGLSQAAAKATVEALAKGQIANCLIRY